MPGKFNGRMIRSLIAMIAAVAVAALNAAGLAALLARMFPAAVDFEIAAAAIFAALFPLVLVAMILAVIGDDD